MMQQSWDGKNVKTAFHVFPIRPRFRPNAGGTLYGTVVSQEMEGSSIWTI